MRKTKSIAILLSLLFALSALCGLLISKSAPMDNLLDVFNIFYTLLILTIFISAFRKYKLIHEIVNKNHVRIKKVTIVLIIIGIIPFVINFYITYWMLTAGFVDYELIKNTALGKDIVASLPIKRPFITLAHYLAQVSYFLLGFGFYYAHLKKYKISFICFVLSLNMPLLGMSTLSRTLPVTYFYLLLVYFLYSIYLYNAKLRKRIILILAVLILPTSIYFYDITENRFKDKYYSVDNAESIVHNPLIYSSLSYNSQWIPNGITVLSNFYSPDAVTYGKYTNILIPGLYKQICRTIFGMESDVEVSRYKREDILPFPYYTGFNGLVADLVFDFGYFFTIVFSLICAYIINSLAPRSGKTTVFRYVIFGLILSVPLFAPYGSWFSVYYYHLGLLYSLVIYFYIKCRVSSKGRI